MYIDYALFVSVFYICFFFLNFSLFWQFIIFFCLNTVSNIKIAGYNDSDKLICFKSRLHTNL